MTPASSADHWSRLEKLFYQALDLDPAARAAFLDQACIGDAALRQEVESLLESSQKAEGFLEGMLGDAARQFGNEKAGQRAGPYQFVRLLGEGGMGKVYLASRADKLYEQEVAIKLMHAGLQEARAMLQRFRSERQILANLNHPNIARLLDGGITAEGAPFLVMEYVQGVPIDEYCRMNHLALKDRLRLFQTVCGAVEYAHKNLVVHRDIKPANILVTLEGVPKLLDFGIAKLLDPESGEPAFTRNTESLMTPDYASPEQVRGEPVTTATDVYTLGILIYELLTGARAFRLESRSPLEIAQVICQQDPELPSALVRKSSEAGAHELARQLAGDLDNIVLTAMRKEPGRRYASVGALSADVAAYLEGYPVHARTATWSYRSGKFVRRHKVPVIAAVTVAVMLIGFAVGMAWLANRATEERDAAQRESQFLNSIFEAATPEAARGKQVTARALLDAGAKRVETDLADRPVLQATMLHNIGVAYTSLGEYERAAGMLRNAYDLRRRTLGNNNLDTAASLYELGMALRLDAKYRDAEPLFRQALAIRQRLLHSDLTVAHSLSSLGECLYWESHWKEAERLLRQALAIKRTLGPAVPEGGTWNFLGLVLEREGNYQEAGQLLHEAVELSRRSQAADEPSFAVSLHNLSGYLINIGDLSGAETTAREVLAIRRKILGNDHPDLYYSLNNLGWILIKKGDWKSAEPLLLENLKLVRKVFGETSTKMVVAQENWGLLQQERRDYPGARQSFQAALEMARKTAGEDSWYVARVLAGFGELEFDARRYAPAEKYARQSLALSEKLGGAESPDVASALIDLAEDRVFQNDPRAADPLLRRALAIKQRQLQPGHPEILATQVRLGEALTVEGKVAEAEPILRQAMSSVNAEPFRLQPWQVAEAESALGACLTAGGRLSVEGERLLRESEKALEKDPRPAFRQPANTRFALPR